METANHAIILVLIAGEMQILINAQVVEQMIIDKLSLILVTHLCLLANVKILI
jgi:hypothetical protein